MSLLGLIGGTGLETMPGLTIDRVKDVDTRFGAPSSSLRFGVLGNRQVVFLSRHGDAHAIPPHLINYRANIRALADAGVSDIVAVAAVGSINQEIEPGTLALPDDLIDYSWGREPSFWDESDSSMRHIEFAPPYSADLRYQLIAAAGNCGVSLTKQGVYGVTQGPRLETAAEIRRMKKDGCDVVGMTAMPEASLAREMNIPYASISMVINWAAGISDGSIHADIERYMSQCVVSVKKLLEAFCVSTNVVSS